MFLNLKDHASNPNICPEEGTRDAGSKVSSD